MNLQICLATSGFRSRVEWLMGSGAKKMIKECYFDRFDGPGWPQPHELEPYFLAPKGQEWTFETGNDGWGLKVDGLYDTERLSDRERVTVRLYMTGHPVHGVYLYYRLWDGRVQRSFGYNSKGDLARLYEYVRTMHGDPLPVGLFIPFAEAWKAVKEFIERDGELPTSIAWVANSDLPPNVFPDHPGAVP
jgi:hypothetical protein